MSYPSRLISVVSIKASRILKAGLDCSKALLALTAVVWLASGCLFVSHYEKLTDEYALSALDAGEQMSLVYLHDGDTRVGVVSPTVTAYSQHEHYLVIVREPLGDDDTSPEYFFVPLSEPRFSERGEENVAGPLSLDAVSDLVLERGGTSPIDFTRL